MDEADEAAGLIELNAPLTSRFSYLVSLPVFMYLWRTRRCARQTAPAATSPALSLSSGIRNSIRLRRDPFLESVKRPLLQIKGIWNFTDSRDFLAFPVLEHVNRPLSAISKFQRPT